MRGIFDRPNPRGGARHRQSHGPHPAAIVSPQGGALNSFQPILPNNEIQLPSLTISIK